MNYSIKEIINKKKHGKALSEGEIRFFVEGFTNDEIPAYQISALLMAIYFKGMDKKEIAILTDAMVKSGDIVDLTSINGIKVDKHSTGGVGDKISIIAIPLVASLGIPVGKMSGRGLGHTGGTVDKLESIPGFNIELSPEKFLENVNKYGLAIVGQSGNLTPADKKLYALRDVTETVDSIPLIASSIMSKKIASGADAIVLDVKCGTGAFMKDLESAKQLSKTMVEIGKSLGRKTIAIITNMDQPLGHEVGNANEVKEVIDVLSGKGSEDETEIALCIASYMAVLSGKFSDPEVAKEMLKQNIQNGKALEMLKTFISAQGGDARVVDDVSLLKESERHISVKSKESGFVKAINAENIGLAALYLGAGRLKKEDGIDYSCGVTTHKKIGDNVEIGDVLFTMHTNLIDTYRSEELLYESITLSESKPEKIKYILDIITEDKLND